MRFWIGVDAEGTACVLLNDTLCIVELLVATGCGFDDSKAGSRLDKEAALGGQERRSVGFLAGC